MKIRKMIEEGMEYTFFFFAIIGVLIIFVTSPIWILPYGIYRLIKGKK